jgi:hypothetical protein
MNLDTFIVERVIGLVDGAEHNVAPLSVSVVTAAPRACRVVDQIVQHLLGCD